MDQETLGYEQIVTQAHMARAAAFGAAVRWVVAKLAHFFGHHDSHLPSMGKTA